MRSSHNPGRLAAVHRGQVAGNEPGGHTPQPCCCACTPALVVLLACKRGLWGGALVLGGACAGGHLRRVEQEMDGPCAGHSHSFSTSKFYTKFALGSVGCPLTIVVGVPLLLVRPRGGGNRRRDGLDAGKAVPGARDAAALSARVACHERGEATLWADAVGPHGCMRSRVWREVITCGGRHRLQALTWCVYAAFSGQAKGRAPV